MDIKRAWYKVFDTKEEIEEFKLRAQNRTLKDLAAYYGVGYEKMRCMVLEYGANCVKPDSHTHEGKVMKLVRKNEIGITNEFIQSHTRQDCAKYYGVNVRYIDVYCKINNVTTLPNDDISNWAYTFNKGKIRYVYYDMLRRCTKLNDRHYKDYGGRGIRVCNEWKENCCNFYRWAKTSGYKEGLQLDRKNTEGNYSPDTCRWVTPRENNYNRRCTRIVTYKGKAQSLLEWEKETGLRACVLADRIFKYKWNIERALTQPLEIHNKK